MAKTKSVGRRKKRESQKREGRETSHS